MMKTKTNNTMGLFSAIGGLLGSVVSGIFGSSAARKQRAAQTKWNRRQRLWREKMYGIKKQDALSFWKRQNLYNAPSSQMQRLIKAGLNPNLMYGQGNVGNASPISTPDISPWNPKTPDVGAITGSWSNLVTDSLDLIGKYAGIRQVNAQTSNTEAATKLQEAQTVNAGLKAQGLILGNKLSNINVKKANDLYSTQVDYSKQLLINAKKQAKIQNASAKKVLNMAKHEALKMANTKAERKVIEQNYNNLRTKGKLYQVELRMKRNGIDGAGMLKPLYMLLLNSTKHLRGGKSFGETLVPMPSHLR